MKVLPLIFILFLASYAQAQPPSRGIYNPAANAIKDISEAIKSARLLKKHVLILTGGNWCSWCLEFDRFTISDREIDSLMKTDFVVYHLNYSPENKNQPVMSKYGYPQRFGFPVFLILDESGNRLHTQNSTYLEQGRSYNKKKVMEFLEHWRKKSIDPGVYKNY